MPAALQTTPTALVWPLAHAALPDRFARLALANVQQPYPNKLDHTLNSAADLQSPRDLHPLFFGSYDWHSAVHMHWLMARLLRLGPANAAARDTAAWFTAQFTCDNVARELAYLQQPSTETFERTYGWAWLLKLQTELLALASEPDHADLLADHAAHAHQSAQAAQWASALQPLADAFADRFLAFLPQASHPIRAGTHANSAFGLLLALDYAQAMQHFALKKCITERAHRWFGKDQRYPAHYEPGGDDFLSGGLVEAALMRRVVDGCSFADWWDVFCPTRPSLQQWLTPVQPGNRADPKLSHLDGLNLSRAWCWRLLLPELPTELALLAQTAIDAHLAASLPQASSGHYVGTHWLASFAALALTD